MIALMLFAAPRAMAEENAILDALDLEEMESYASEQGVDLHRIVQSIISGELPLRESIAPLLETAKQQVLSDFEDIAGRIFLPIACMMVLKLIFSKGYSSGKAVSFICRLCCISALAVSFAEMCAVALHLLSKIAACADLLSPAMLAAVTLAGAETTAAFLSPMAGICSQTIQHILTTWGIGLASAAAGIAIAGNLSEEIPLKRLSRLLKQIVHTGVGGILAAFIAILSLQGRLGVGRDTAAARTSRYAIENMIPVVGGSVSDSLDSLLSTAYIVKNALGAGVSIMIVCLCLVPILRLAGAMFFLRLTAAVSEPMGDRTLTAMIGQFGDAIELLLIICIASATLCGLLVGSCIGAASGIVR